MAPMYKIPNVYHFKDTKSFFHEFYQSNLPAISHRKFADEIDWPVSLLGDLIQGRKSLSVNRAVEFANFAKLTSILCEHLIMMGLRDSENSAARTYANDYLEKSTFRAEDPSSMYTLEAPPEIAHHAERLVLQHFLVWSQGQMDYELLANVLPSFKKFQDQEFVKRLLQEMADLGLVDGTTPPIKVLKKNILHLTPRRTSFVKTYGAFVDLMETLPFNTTIFQGTMLFPRNKLLELLHRKDAFEKWFLATGAVSDIPTDYKPEDNTILFATMSFGELLEHNAESPERLQQYTQTRAIPGHKL